MLQRPGKNNSKPFNKDWDGPLTHIMLINIPWAKKSEKFIKAVENTDCISPGVSNSTNGFGLIPPIGS